MASENLNYLLSSPFENDRIKVIYFIVKHRRTEFSDVLKKIADEDESLNVRYYARKACAFLDSITAQENREAEISSELEKESVRRKAIQEKIGSLGDSEKAEERIIAVRGAVKYRIDGLLEFLMRRLILESDENVVATIIKSLGYTENSLVTDILIKYLASPDYRIAANAIEALGVLGDPKAFPHVVALLNNRDNRITANIIEYLKKYDVESALKLLEEMVDFPSDAMADSAVFVLSGFKSRRVLPLLEKLRVHRNQTIALKADAAFKAINSDGENEISIDTLIKNIEMPAPPDKTMEAAATPEKNEGEEKIEKIRNMISNPADPKVASDLDDILKNEKDEYVLAYAISACSKLQGTKNLSTLKKFLGHPNPRIKANTVEVIGTIEGADLLSVLKPLLKDKNNRVRANAIVALKKYPNIDHVSLIGEMIKSGEKLMVTSAIYSIIQIKGDTIELLKDLVKAEDEEVRERALSALDFLGNDLNDLNAKKLLNDLGIGTKNVAKSAEYIFSKTVLDQLDVAYKDNLSDVSLIPAKKKPLEDTVSAVKTWFSDNLSAILNILILLIVLSAGFLSWPYVSSFEYKKFFSSISLFRGQTEFPITIFYTSNLDQIFKSSTPTLRKNDKINKLKNLIQNETDACAKTNTILLCFDAGTILTETAENNINTEPVFEFLNQMKYSAVVPGGRDLNYCFNYLAAAPTNFILPVLCSHVIGKDSKPPSFIKQFSFVNKPNFNVCTLGFCDAAGAPQNVSRNYKFVDCIKAADKILSPENVKPSEYNLLIGLMHYNFDYTREFTDKVANFDVIINLGNDFRKSQPTNYFKTGSTYVLPSKYSQNSAYCGKFEFKYDKKSRSVKDPRWSLNEL